MSVTSSPGVRTTAARTAATARPHPTTRPRSGRFTFDVRTSTWHISPQLTALLGEPATVSPGVDVLLDHVHPTERTALLTELAGCIQGIPFVVEHRLVGADGTETVGTVVAEPETDATGDVVAVAGTVLAVPASRAPGADDDRAGSLQAEVEQMRTAMASRSQIEQAKGVLMLLTGFTEQACFDLLGHISSHTHRKVRELAGEITASAVGRGPLPEDIRAILQDACPPPPAAR